MTPVFQEESARAAQLALAAHHAALLYALLVYALLAGVFVFGVARAARSYRKARDAREWKQACRAEASRRCAMLCAYELDEIARESEARAREETMRQRHTMILALRAAFYGVPAAPGPQVVSHEEFGRCQLKVARAQLEAPNN